MQLCKDGISLVERIDQFLSGGKHSVRTEGLKFLQKSLRASKYEIPHLLKQGMSCNAAFRREGEGEGFHLGGGGFSVPYIVQYKNLRPHDMILSPFNVITWGNMHTKELQLDS